MNLIVTEYKIDAPNACLYACIRLVVPNKIIS